MALLISDVWVRISLESAYPRHFGFNDIYLASVWKGFFNF